MAASVQKRRVTVSFQVLDEGARIAIGSEDPMRPRSNAAEEKEFLALLMQQLGGELMASPNAGDSHRFLLFFPRGSGQAE